MNVKELIEKIEALPDSAGYIRPKIDKNLVLGLVRELDEPKKVKVPQFVADWYEKHKDDFEYDIWEYILHWDKQQKSEFYEWMNRVKNKPIQTLVNMHQFGYEVEEEKRYTVKFKNIQKGTEYLKYDRVVERWYFGLEEYSIERTIYHIRKELEQAGFGWVFYCDGVEVEEVTE